MKAVKQALYYEQPELYEIEAKVLSIHPRDDRMLIELDPSPFFPGKGGQPADIGWIGGVPVVGYETFFPLVEAKTWLATFPQFQKDMRVICRLDGKHRQEYREQHTGQHLVSALLKKILQVDTVSVHFGEQTTTIEVAQESLPEGYRELIQEEANRKILENPPVRTFWIDENRHETPSLRRIPDLEGPLRVVEIEGVDRTACSGIHLDSLAPLRMALLVGEERIRGRIRLHLLVGERAVRRLSRYEEILSSLRSVCTAGTEDLPRAVKSLQEEIKSLTQRLSSLKREYYLLKMKEWLQTGTELVVSEQRRGVFLSLALTEGDAEDLRFMEEAFLSQAKGLLLLGLVRKGKEGESVSFVGAQNLNPSEENRLPGLDLREAFREPLKLHGGKGGGTPSRIQGSFPSKEQWEKFRREIEVFFRTA